MRESDANSLYLQQMSDAHPFVRFELEAMTVEALVTVAKGRDNRRYLCQLVEHAIYVNVTGMHYEIDSVEGVEDCRRQMIAGLRDMGVRDDSDSHRDGLRAFPGGSIESIMRGMWQQFRGFDRRSRDARLGRFFD